jgi:L-lactate dehydrogenase complex protein LldG
VTDAAQPPGARAGILGRIQSSLDGRTDRASREASASQRLTDRRANLVPARAQLAPADQVDLFVRMAEEADATVTRVATAAAVPAAVADWLRQNNRPMNVRRAPDPALDAYPWAAQALMTVEAGKAESTDETSVTAAHCGVAETGTLMLTSAEDRPTTLNFLPESHIVVLRADQVVASYEDGWTALRQAQTVDSGWIMPRTVNFITGPSRSADIEQTLQLGAHGPRQLHIIVVGAPADDDDPANSENPGNPV